MQGLISVTYIPVAYLDSQTWWGINRRAKRAGKFLLINIHEGIINSKLMCFFGNMSELG